MAKKMQIIYNLRAIATMPITDQEADELNDELGRRYDDLMQELAQDIMDHATDTYNAAGADVELDVDVESVKII